MKTFHPQQSPTPVISASPTVKADSIALARAGVDLTPHDKPNHPTLPRKIAAGSSCVLIDGIPAARSGDAINRGGTLIGGGSSNIG